MYHIALLSVHWALCLLLIVLVILLQQGKGADMGVAFGGGSSTLFGASGANSLLIKITTIVAMLFMSTSILLVRHYNAGGLQVATPGQALKGSVVEDIVKKQEGEAANKPAAETAAPVEIPQPEMPVAPVESKAAEAK